MYIPSNTSLFYTVRFIGNPTESGCYCSVCMKGFTTALINDLNVTEHTMFNITSSFNYRLYLLQKKEEEKTLLLNNKQPITTNNINNTESSSSKQTILRQLFKQYQRNVTSKYLSKLSNDILPPEVPLSCNNGGIWNDIYKHCDMGMGELPSTNANPGGLREIFIESVPKGKHQVMTMPKSKNLTLDGSESFMHLIRRSIAESYALGANMLIPWDIYLPTPHAARYFGDAGNFSDLFLFVRENALLFDEMDITPFQKNSTNGFSLVHTGSIHAGGDGIRYRLPSDHPPSAGYISTYSNQGSCAWQCHNNVMCVAFFSASVNGVAGDCALLFTPLDIINGTEVIGNSWKKKFMKMLFDTNNNGAWSNLTFVDVVVRGNSTDGDYDSFWAIHLINWGTGNSIHDGEKVAVFLKNDDICSGDYKRNDKIRSNETGGFLLQAKLISPSFTPPIILWNGPPDSNGITVLIIKLSMLQPWGLINIHCANVHRTKKKEDKYMRNQISNLFR